MRLNIGCGRDYKPGWINTDASQEVTADQYFILGEEDIPQETESAEEIYISGVLEQIGPNEQFVHALNECWRVLKKGGMMTVVVPNARHAVAHRDPFDVRKFTKETFFYFAEGSREYELYGSVYGFKPWSNMHIEENDRHIFTVRMVKC